MNLLYINYWSLGDALTEATVFPNLEILQPYFSNTYLTSVERGEKLGSLPEKIHHIAYHSPTRLPRGLTKAIDLVFFSLKQLILARRKSIHLVICRGSMAAIFGVVLNRILGLPFIVESFEPHADYMTESGTWKKRGIETKLQKWAENETMKRALYLMPVSNNYRNHMINSSVDPGKIYVMPCCVDLKKFEFRQNARSEIRKKLNLPDTTVVGIYVGKFGDIYLDSEAFCYFKQVGEFFTKKFFLIILSPQESFKIKQRLTEFGISETSFFVDRVKHDDVPLYLCASDFAFSLVRPSPSRKYCCPIKNGEYWANGLPIISTSGIGDDSEIIENENGGIVVSGEKIPNSALEKIQSLIEERRNGNTERNKALAIKYRNFEIIRRGYSKILNTQTFNQQPTINI